MTIGLVTTTGTVSSKLHQNRRRNVSAWLECSAWPASLWLPCCVVGSRACAASCGSRCTPVIRAASDSSSNKRTFVAQPADLQRVLEPDGGRRGGSKG